MHNVLAAKCWVLALMVSIYPVVGQQSSGGEVLPELPIPRITPSAIQSLEHIKAEIKEMFTHAYDGYMKYAFPLDELKPLTCEGKDTWGGYSLTLVDALDTLLILGNTTEFERVVVHLGTHLDVNRDVNVSLFETNIRVVGGLLSAHLLITHHAKSFGLSDQFVTNYDGSLLRIARDLGQRLLLAFDTATGMPYGTVNLKHGVPSSETTVTCTACISTYSLEFGLLSRLTGDWSFENTAKAAVKELWKRKSSLGLVGNHIDVNSGAWTHRDAGVGASIDSFYEYLIKSAILFDDDLYFLIFEDSYSSALKSLRKNDWYVQADMLTGQVTWAQMSTLQAFWPGMQTLYGDIQDASYTMRAFMMLWRLHGFTPEGYNLVNNRVDAAQAGYPLRPEMIESLYMLHLATNDDTWLEFGLDILHSIQNYTKTKCGYAVVEDVRKMQLGNAMESFFLAETLKYLYLLFDRTNVINSGGFIFNTEGHPFPLDYEFSSFKSPLKDDLEEFKREANITSVAGKTACKPQDWLESLSTAVYPLSLQAQIEDKASNLILEKTTSKPTSLTMGDRLREAVAASKKLQIGQPIDAKTILDAIANQGAKTQLQNKGDTTRETPLPPIEEKGPDSVTLQADIAVEPSGSDRSYPTAEPPDPTAQDIEAPTMEGELHGVGQAQTDAAVEVADEEGKIDSQPLDSAAEGPTDVVVEVADEEGEITDEGIDLMIREQMEKIKDLLTTEQYDEMIEAVWDAIENGERTLVVEVPITQELELEPEEEIILEDVYELDFENETEPIE